MEKITGLHSALIQPDLIQKKKVEETTTSFQSMLVDAIKKVDQTQKESELLTNQLVTGEVQDIHQVMVAAQKASITLQLTVQVRNKVIESYQEIMRMQV